MTEQPKPAWLMIDLGPRGLPLTEQLAGIISTDDAIKLEGLRQAVFTLRRADMISLEIEDDLFGKIAGFIKQINEAGADYDQGQRN